MQTTKTHNKLRTKKSIKLKNSSRCVQIALLYGKIYETVNKNVQLHIDPPRKTSIALKDTLKQELDNMENKNIIRKVTEPTDWVSNQA